MEGDVVLRIGKQDVNTEFLERRLRALIDRHAALEIHIVPGGSEHLRLHTLEFELKE